MDLSLEHNSTSPVVSIVLPTFNREACIQQSVESILRQTWTDFELIIVDDSSKDGTAEKIKTISDPRIRVLQHKRNKGAAEARNTGIQAARAPIIAFQDSDDEWLPTKLEKQLDRLRSEPEAVACYCGMIILGALEADPQHSERPEVRYFPDADFGPLNGAIFETLLVRNSISTQTLVVHREAFTAVGGFDQRAVPLEDWDAVLQLAERGLICFIDEPLVIQRFSKNSITRNRLNHVRAREHILQKNAKFMSTRPNLLASHHYSIAGVWRELGKYKNATIHLRKCISANPWNIRAWLMYTYAGFWATMNGFKVKVRNE